MLGSTQSSECVLWREPPAVAFVDHDLARDCLPLAGNDRHRVAEPHDSGKLQGGDFDLWQRR